MHKLFERTSCKNIIWALVQNTNHVIITQFNESKSVTGTSTNTLSSSVNNPTKGPVLPSIGRIFIAEENKNFHVTCVFLDCGLQS